MQGRGAAAAAPGEVEGVVQQQHHNHLGDLGWAGRCSWALHLWSSQVAVPSSEAAGRG